MGIVFKIKMGNSENGELPVLQEGELGFDKGAGTLYVGIVNDAGINENFAIGGLTGMYLSIKGGTLEGPLSVRDSTVTVFKADPNDENVMTHYMEIGVSENDESITETRFKYFIGNEEVNSILVDENRVKIAKNLEVDGIASCNGGIILENSNGAFTGMLNQLEQDNEHLTVSQSEKDSWFSGNYNDLNNLPNLPDFTTIDTEIVENGTNPVTGGAIYLALANKSNTGHTHSGTDITSGTINSSRLPTALKATTTISTTSLVAASRLRNIMLATTEPTSLDIGVICLVYES